MKSNRSLPKGILIASLAAGPIFLTAAAATSLYLELPKPVSVTAAAITGFAFLLLPSAIGGFIISIFPNVAGATVMNAVSATWPMARAPITWPVAGGAIGGAFLLLFGGAGFSPEVTVALPVTCAACASIWRSYVRFE